ADTLNEKQLIQQQALKQKKPHVDRNGIKNWLNRLKYPLYCLDFETINPAVPLFDGTRPYQQVPFQFSLHAVERPGAAPKHFEYLAGEPVDPRPGLIEGLRAIGPKGTVLAYNVTFERRVLNELANSFPDKRSFLQGIVSRLDDLIVSFRSFNYYHPDQRGSCSLKDVLPAVTSKSYENLAIHEGKQAAREYHRVVFGETSASEKELVLANLREYCRQDTEAMTDILNALMELV
ncbi:MAG: DUF2779 domain-containing protein, partial [Candidatus Krumholzibacteria bacterium]|nr:DUF2779 domain-containing protein [Candidatus Krumholzibacteria bacterium]